MVLRTLFSLEISVQCTPVQPHIHSSEMQMNEAHPGCHMFKLEQLLFVLDLFYFFFGLFVSVFALFTYILFTFLFPFLAVLIQWGSEFIITFSWTLVHFLHKAAS